MNRQLYLLPWVRVLLLIRSITSTTWGHERWPLVKPLLRSRFGDAPTDRPGRLMELDARGRRLRAAQREQIKKRFWVFVLRIGRFNIAAY